jgi:ATP-dependent protease ClpP protease subunit
MSEKETKETKKDKVEEPENVEESDGYDLDKIDDIVELLKNEDEDTIKGEVSHHLEKIIKKFDCDNYHPVFLFDKYESISKTHSDNIYQSISKLENKKDIFLFLLSDGGKIEPAYLISKTCKRLCKDKFVITIPRQAKSAATLISLGADELHMGLLSELGPIDPQFGGFPALGFTDALKRIASLSAEFPGSGDMFAKYLSDNLNLRDLGYLERINESAAQYAERLLKGKKFPKETTPSELANHFTNHYKDHGFVIDLDEASSLLGSGIVKEKTKEYYVGDIIYSFLSFVDLAAGYFLKKNVKYVGGIENGFKFIDKEE